MTEEKQKHPAVYYYHCYYYYEAVVLELCGPPSVTRPLSPPAGQDANLSQTTHVSLDGSRLCDDAAPPLLTDVPLGELQPGGKVSHCFPEMLLLSSSRLSGWSRLTVCCCLCLQLKQRVFVRCASTGPRLLLFHVAYSIDTTVEGRLVVCKCHKVRKLPGLANPNPNPG